MTSAASTARPREASPNDVLPFGEFLTALRARGVPAGIKEFESAAKLLRAWSGIDRDALRDAISALLARDQQEVETIRSAFDEWFPVVPREVPVRSRRWLVIAAAALFFAATAVIAQVWYRTVAWPTNTPPLANPVSAGNPVVEALSGQAASLPPPPKLPPPPRAADTRVPLASAAGLALMLTWIAVEIRTRRRRRAWTQEYHEELLESGTGPTRYTPVVSYERPLVPDAWMNEVASILGRGEDDTPGLDLDVNESLRRTLRNGMLPHLVFAPPPRNAFLLLLEDVHSHMRPWRPKIESFVAGLQRQRVDYERWFFEGGPGTVWRAGATERTTLERLFSMRGGASLLVLSTGETARAIAENDVLRHVLKRWTFRSWLNPIANPTYWNEELKQLPIRVWPFTLNGFRGMAWDLARMPQWVDEKSGDAAREVTADDIERMKRLIALVPQPTAALADELRRRYASDVPEEVILFLVAEGVFRGERFQLAPEELARLIATQRADVPARELRVRKYLLEVLRDSEPERGSLAHLRWQIDVAMQRLQLARVEGTPAAPAVESLVTLAAGPLRQEVKGAIAAAPLDADAAAVLQRKVRKAGTKVPEMVVRDAGSPPRFAPPGLLALLAIAVVTFLAWTQFAEYLGKGRGAEIPHVLDAYKLEVLPPQRVGDAATLRVTPKAGSPRNFDIWRVERDFGFSVGTQFELAIPETGAGTYFQVRALLPAGNLALSDAVWVPPATVEQQVIAIIADVLDVDPATITLESDLRRDLAANGENVDEIAARLDQAFGTRIFLSGDPLPVSDIVRRVQQGERMVRVTVVVSLDSIPLRGVAVQLMETRTGSLAIRSLIAPEMIEIPPGTYLARINIRDRALTVRSVTIPNEPGYSLSINLTQSDVPYEAFQRNQKLGVIAANVFTRNDSGESALGNLFADALRASSGADFAIINSRALRTDLRKGGLTYADIANVLPFDNYPATLRLSGQQIVDLLRVTSSGRFGVLQVSGLRYGYDPSRQGAERLIGVSLADRSPIDLRRQYTVIMPDYIAAGGDGTEAVMNQAVRMQVGTAATSPLLRDIIVRQLQKSGKPLNPNLDGRISVLNRPSGN